MGGATVQLNVAAHHRTGEAFRFAQYRTYGFARDVVQGESFVGVVSVQDFCVEELLRSGARLLGGLEEQENGPFSRG